MIDAGFARRFAKEWIEDWNSRDLDKVLAHYSPGFEMSSPMIRSLVGEPSGVLKGRAAVGAYWKKALEAFPETRFTLLKSFAGANSVLVIYEGVKGGISAESFFFNDEGKIEKAAAYSLAGQEANPMH